MTEMKGSELGGVQEAWASLWTPPFFLKPRVDRPNLSDASMPLVGRLREGGEPCAT